jgi:hypothetical protein
LIEQLFESGDADAANHFLRAALKLEIRGEMAEDEDFRKRFAGVFKTSDSYSLN